MVRKFKKGEVLAKLFLHLVTSPSSPWRRLEIAGSLQDWVEARRDFFHHAIEAERQRALGEIVASMRRSPAPSSTRLSTEVRHGFPTPNPVPGPVPEGFMEGPPPHPDPVPGGSQAEPPSYSVPVRARGWTAPVPGPVLEGSKDELPPSLVPVPQEFVEDLSPLPVPVPEGCEDAPSASAAPSQISMTSPKGRLPGRLHELSPSFQGPLCLPWSGCFVSLQALEKDLKGETHGDFERLLVALITPPAEYDCHEVMQAMKGVGTKDSTLIEIFASRSIQQIKALQDAYLKETKTQLTAKLKSEVSGDFSTALTLLAEGKRDKSNTVDVGKAKEDAKALYNAGEKKWGTDESKFIEILCQRSVPQLRQTLIEYKNISGKTLQQSIEGEMCGELEELLVAVVKCVKSLPAYFAELLHQSMKGGGTDESTVTRIMVSRSEIDLLDIRAEFKKLYQHSLLSVIQSDMSGDYGECMKAICGGDD
ncbi:hypothetical protein CHARACLAT_008214 [Characodon lateralis]|uniref:Annexin n=1 Tax=Characodon lateralis TaxID=208331 RepID=A0ABU7EC95_9TELE|nr:hypothetical protein [Characodon lateralis]